MNGIIFCHGHSHNRLNLDPNVRWIYVDVDPDVQPDIVGEYQQQELIEILGRKKYDYVYEIRCPFFSLEDIENYLNLSSDLLKKGGQVFLFNGIQRVFIFLHPDILFLNSYLTLTNMGEESYQETKFLIENIAEHYGLRIKEINKGSIYFEKVV